MNHEPVLHDRPRELTGRIDDALRLELSRRLYDPSLRSLGDALECDCGVRRTGAGYAVRVTVRLDGFRVQIDREGGCPMGALSAAFDSAISIIAPARATPSTGCGATVNN